MLVSHLDAENRYHALRQLAISTIAGQLPAGSGATLRLIDDAALKASQVWESSKTRLVDWDWFAYYPSFKYRHPKRFELAVWAGPTLISLSLGRPTYNATALRLDFIEASPEQRSSKAFPIVIAAMATYAEALGAQEIRVMHPINDEVKNYYARFGLTYVAQGDYLYTRL